MDAAPHGGYRIQKTTVQSWLNDIVDAQNSGKRHAIIHTPTDEWPHPKEWFGDRLSRTLFQHGTTNKQIKIHINVAFIGQLDRFSLFITDIFTVKKYD